MIRFVTITLSLFFLSGLSACSNPENATLAPPSSFILKADCEGFCQLEKTCITDASDADIAAYCSKSCELGDEALTCQYDAFTKYCKEIYIAYHDCIYTIDNCEDMEAYVVQMGLEEDTEGTIADREVCTEEIRNLWHNCYIGEQMIPVGKKCEDELSAYKDYLDNAPVDGAAGAADAGDPGEDTAWW